MENKFQEIGNYWIQMGLYLCTVSPKEFEERTQIKENMINFLMQSYLYLKNQNNPEMFEVNNEKEVKEETSEDSYLSRKEVIALYSPLFTEYGLTQSIHVKGLPHIKRGSKYFFKKSEIDDWIKNNNGNFGNKSIKYV